MNADQAVARLAEVIRRKHLALNTEQSYCGWLRRYCQQVAGLPAGLPSEQKIEQFLTALAKTNISASTQNQAFNAIVFFYKEALEASRSEYPTRRAQCLLQGGIGDLAARIAPRLRHALPQSRGQPSRHSAGNGT